MQPNPYLCRVLLQSIDRLSLAHVGADHVMTYALELHITASVLLIHINFDPETCFSVELQGSRVPGNKYRSPILFIQM